MFLRVRNKRLAVLIPPERTFTWFMPTAPRIPSPTWPWVPVLLRLWLCSSEDTRTTCRYALSFFFIETYFIPKIDSWIVLFLSEWNSAWCSTRPKIEMLVSNVFGVTFLFLSFAKLKQVEEGANLVKQAIMAGVNNDLGSGTMCNLVIIRKDKDAELRMGYVFLTTFLFRHSKFSILKID